MSLLNLIQFSALNYQNDLEEICNLHTDTEKKWEVRLIIWNLQYMTLPLPWVSSSGNAVLTATFYYYYYKW